MGADIHFTYQRVGKRKRRELALSQVLGVEPDKEIMESPDWEYIEDGPVINEYGERFIPQWRNYSWFGRLSEVRGWGPRITHEGFPEDVDINDEEYEWCHSHSHIYLNELLEVEWTQEDKNDFGWFILESIPTLKQYCNENNLEYNEFRILMCYDS